MGHHHPNAQDEDAGYSENDEEDREAWLVPKVACSRGDKGHEKLTDTDERHQSTDHDQCGSETAQAGFDLVITVVWGLIFGHVLILTSLDEVWKGHPAIMTLGKL